MLVGNPFVVEFVSIDSIVGKLRARTQQTPPGNWVEGFFYDDTKVKDKRPVNMQDLDQVSQVHPVAVHHRGGREPHESGDTARLRLNPRRPPKTR